MSVATEPLNGVLVVIKLRFDRAKVINAMASDSAKVRGPMAGDLSGEKCLRSATKAAPKPAAKTSTSRPMGPGAR